MPTPAACPWGRLGPLRVRGSGSQGGWSPRGESPWGPGAAGVRAALLGHAASAPCGALDWGSQAVAVTEVGWGGR